MEAKRFPNLQVKYGKITRILEASKKKQESKLLKVIFVIKLIKINNNNNKYIKIIINNKLTI